MRPVPEPGDVCGCCGYEESPIPLMAYRRSTYDAKIHNPEHEWVFLCDVCSKTFLSHAVMYSSLADRQLLFSSIGWIANEIFRRLDEIQGVTTPEAISPPPNCDGPSDSTISRDGADVA